MSKLQQALIVLGVALLRGLPLLPGSVVAGLLAAGLVLHVCWLAPLFLGGRPQPADGVQEVVMMSSNVLKGRADAGAHRGSRSRIAAVE